MALEALRHRAREDWDALQQSHKPLILVGTATCGRAAGSLQVLETLRKELEERSLDCSIIEVGCIGQCYAEPIVCITKPARPCICYGSVTTERVKEIIQGYLVNDDPLPEYALGTVGEGSVDGIPRLFDTPVLRRQVRRVLRNCGFIDPTNIDHYVANNGYSGLAKALNMAPDEVIDELKRAGLRGRGGAGFPTWLKWQFCRKAEGDEKYFICNADEGDPGAFMNRSLLEGDPHSLLEGLLIAGYTIGAREGYIYCRAEYPLALERLETAIGQAEEHGLLGEDILGSGFDFRITVKEGAVAFVCGEETALIASIEGKRGEPRPRPPFPATSGLWGKPTTINNVETLASVALVLQNGADWFAQCGTDNSKGTKTFALVGKVKRSSLVEVPLGITLREMIHDIGGGILGDKQFKAVQTGGPSGGCLPASLLDLPVDYESLTAAGSIMGSGGMVVMDEDTCMVDVARYFLQFTHDESCGKCVPCRMGSQHLLRLLEEITEGKGELGHIEALETLSRTVKNASLCGLGQTLPNPVLSTLRYFRDEYEAHIKGKRCPATVCKEIISSPCQHVCPIDTQAPLYISLIAERRFKEAFEVILADNPLPSACARICYHPCESKCQAGKWGNPIAIRALKRFATDYASSAGIYPGTEQQRTHGGKVAIVGSGPAGLMAGYRLARKGYDVTIFEELDVPGGALAVYIPEYRLPKSRLNLDIENIKNGGVTIRTNTRIGDDIPFDELLSNYEAVFVATGAHKSRPLNVDNESAIGVMHALDFLKDVNLGKEVTLGKTVGVIGGGNAAVDAARTAARIKGCERVVIIYRRTKGEMPAFPEEVDAGIEEGINVQFLTAPTRVLSRNGEITGLECRRMELGELDESGRRRPIPIQGSEFVIDVDSLIVAIGEDPDLRFLGKEHAVNVSRWDTIVVDPETFATNIPGVFAGGDVVTGPKNVIEAMSSGKIAAEMIDKYIRGVPVDREYELTRPSMYLPPVELAEEEIEEGDRPVIPTLPANERVGSFDEVDLNLAEEIAVREARRCLRCDLATEDAKQAAAAWTGRGRNATNDG